MKFLSLKINGFGCHRDQSWEFDPGLNLIVGPNEAGKTTMMRCLLAMLYPLSRRRGGATPEIDLCAPWQGGPYAAALELETAAGRRLSVRKSFVRGEEKVSIVDAQRGDVTNEFLEGPDGKDRDVGATLFNLTREEFQHTAYIRYGEMSWSAYKNGRGQLAKRLEQMVDAQSGASAAQALEVLKAASAELGSDRSSKRPIDVASRELAQLRVRIAELEVRYAEIAERDAERDRLAHELAKLERRIAVEEYLELGDTGRELVSRVEKAAALRKQIADLAKQVGKLGPEGAADPGKEKEELTRCRAVRKEHEKDLAARREQFRIAITERMQTCQRSLAERYARFLEARPQELEGMEEQVRRWQDWSARREDIARSVREEEQRSGNGGMLELQDINLRFLRGPEKTELIETGKERLSELENGLIVKNQELRELDHQRLLARGAVSRMAIGCGAALFAAIFCFAVIAGNARVYSAAALTIAAIVLGVMALLRRGAIAARFQGPLAELESALVALRGERESLFRQLEEVAVSLGFATYKECRAALEKVRRNQMRMGGLQQLQMNQRQVDTDIAALEKDLTEWAGRLGVPLPDGAFSAAHAKALQHAMIDFRAAAQELADLRQEEKKRGEELQDHQKRIRDLEAREREIYVALKLPAEDLDAGYAALEKRLQCHAAFADLSLAREKAQASLEAQCRGKKIEQLEADLAGVRRQRQEIEKRYPEFAQESPESAGKRADEPERARMKNRQRELRDQIRSAEVWIETQRGSVESLPEKREREAELEQRIRSLENYRRRLLLAHQVLAEIALQSHRRWSEELTSEVGPMLSRLTRGRYEQVIVDPELQVHLSPMPEKTLSPDEVERSLSTGTLDQLYLCLRVVVAGLLQPHERLPLLLDDPLLTFDEERRKAALAWLPELAERRQVFLFTCNPQYAEALPGASAHTLALAGAQAPCHQS